MKNRGIAIFIIVILLLSCVICSGNEQIIGDLDTYTVFFNGQAIVSSCVDGITIGNKTYLSVRDFCKLRGYVVEWDNDAKCVKISSKYPEKDDISIAEKSSCIPKGTKVYCTKNSYPIFFKNKSVDVANKGIIAEDKIYLLVDDFATFLGSSIVICDSEKLTVEIFDASYNIMLAGDGYNVDEDNPIFGEGVTEETALVIAHALFKQFEGESYLDGEVISIKETPDKKSFLATKHADDMNMDGGDSNIVIRKADGKIMRVFWGE